MAGGAPGEIVMTRPLTIVGGGLAGLSLAVSLGQRGVGVEVFEKRRYPFHRVCGEFVSGVSESVLRDLGIQKCFSDGVPIGSMAWFMRGRMAMEQALPEPALGISRYTLDARLALLAQQSGVFIHQREGYRAEDREGVVWACGKRLDQQTRWVGLSAHFERLEVDCLEMHCGPLGYLGMSPIEGARVNVTGLFRRESSLKARGVEWIYRYLESNGCGLLAERLRAATLVPDSFAAIAGFEFGAQQATGFALGDRSLLIPPFAGNGMSMALEAAAQAVPLLEAYACGELDWPKTQRRFRALQRESFGLRMNVATRLHPLLLSSFGLRMLGVLASARLLPTQRLFNALR